VIGKVIVFHLQPDKSLFEAVLKKFKTGKTFWSASFFLDISTMDGSFLLIKVFFEVNILECS
jgi:hypothetical protein